MNTKALEKILTKNEIKVYLALLELGTTTTGTLARKSELHTSRVYESLSKLIEKGLVSFVIKSNRKHFSASNPEELLDVLDRHKKEVKEDLVITSKNEYQIGIFYKMSAVSKADDCFDYYFRLKEGVAHNIIKVNKKYKSDTKNYNNKNRNRKKVECPKIDISQYERTKDGKFIVVFE